MLSTLERRGLRALHTTSRTAAGFGLRKGGAPAPAPDAAPSAPEPTPEHTPEPAADPPAPSPNSSVAPFSSPFSSLVPPPFPSSSTEPPARPAEALSIDALWDRVIRAPSAVLNIDSEDSSSDKPSLKSVLDRSVRPRHWSNESAFSASASTSPDYTPSASSSRMRRALGQTRAEGTRVDDALARMFAQIDDRALRPVQGARWADMVRQPTATRRREDEDPELAAEIDAAAESLSVISSPAQVVAWAEEHVFMRVADGKSRGGFPRTYPRLLAAVMKHLRTLGAPHLALAMFEHARQLGVESYVAGCQTSAFNQLLRTRWDAFRDLAGVVAAVQEMESTAVAWDKHTKTIVSSVVDFVSSEILARREGRWGADDTYRLLKELEGMLETDSRRENRVFERKQAEKRAIRQKTRDSQRQFDFDRMSIRKRYVRE